MHTFDIFYALIYAQKAYGYENDLKISQFLKEKLSKHFFSVRVSPQIIPCSYLQLSKAKCTLHC